MQLCVLNLLNGVFEVFTEGARLYFLSASGDELYGNLVGNFRRRSRGRPVLHFFEILCFCFGLWRIPSISSDHAVSVGRYCIPSARQRSDSRDSASTVISAYGLFVDSGSP